MAKEKAAVEEKVKDLSYYMNLPYNMVMERSDDGNNWLGYITELKGCTAEGATREELLRELDHEKLYWIEDALEAGKYIPEPMKNEYSGKFNLRLPKSLHRKLAITAKQEGVSLNQMALYLISHGLAEE